MLKRGYIPCKTLFYYRTHNDKEIVFVTRKGLNVEQLIQVCYNMSSEKTLKRKLDALVEASEELHCDNLINEAKNLLDITGRNVSEISNTLTFNNTNYFIRFFRRHSRRLSE